jgi:FtsH-binding integral membrane protein
MTVGLLVSAAVSYGVAATPSLARAILSNQILFFGLLALEFILVLGLSGLARRLSATEASLLFLIYAAVNGLTLSVIFFIYTTSSIITVFAVTAITFALMSLYGAITKRDLTRFGSLLLMALIGLIVASVINLFLSNNPLNLILSAIGVLIFVGLTAYDTQKLKNMSLAARWDAQAENVAAINGALALYLDFINIFLDLLRLMGHNE